MKDYLIILKGKGALDYTPEELQSRMEMYYQWVEKIGDRFVAANRLENEGVHIKNENEINTDGPFLESNEIIAGYIIIKAKDLEEAASITKTLPLLQFFELIVRPMIDV